MPHPLTTNLWLRHRLRCRRSAKGGTPLLEDPRWIPYRCWWLLAADNRLHWKRGLRCSGDVRHARSVEGVLCHLVCCRRISHGRWSLHTLGYDLIDMRRIFRGGTDGLRGSGAGQLSPACSSLTLSAGGVVSQARWSGLTLHGRTSEAQGWLQLKWFSCIIAKSFPKCVDLGLHLNSSGRSAMLKHAHVSCEERASSRIQIRIWRSDCGLEVVSM